MLKKTTAILLVLCMLFSLAACGGGNSAGTESAAPAEKTEAQGADPTAEQSDGGGDELPPFRIGAITQLTGDNAFGGNEYKNGYELALQHIGGEINGRKIEMVVADGPSQEATLSEFERLYNDGIRVFISGYGCIADRTFATMVDSMGALYQSLAWDADLIQGPGDYFFRTGANVNDFSEGALEQAVGLGQTYLNIEPENLRIAVTYNTRLEHVVAPFKAKAEEMGVDLVLFEGYPNDTKDFVPIITKLMNSEYDIFVPFQGASDGTPFQKKMFEMSYTPPVTMGAGIYYDTPVFAELGNEITNGILTQSYTTPFIADDAAVGIKEFREDYETQYGHAPLTHALQAYGGMYLYFEVLKQVDPSEWEDTAKLAEVMKSLDIDYGQLPWYWGVKFDEVNSNTRSDQMIVNQWIDGKLECIFPDFLSTHEAKVPWTAG